MKTHSTTSGLTISIIRALDPAANEKGKECVDLCYEYVINNSHIVGNYKSNSLGYSIDTL